MVCGVCVGCRDWRRKGSPDPHQLPTSSSWAGLGRWLGSLVGLLMWWVHMAGGVRVDLWVPVCDLRYFPEPHQLLEIEEGASLEVSH